MRISDWSSDVCSSDLLAADAGHHQAAVKDVEDANRAFVAGGAVQQASLGRIEPDIRPNGARCPRFRRPRRADKHRSLALGKADRHDPFPWPQHTFRGGGIGRVGQYGLAAHGAGRSEEHTSELQSLMRISYAVFCLKKNTRLVGSLTGWRQHYAH